MTRPDGQTPEQARWEAEYHAERARQHRLIVDGLRIWEVCSSKPCRRQRHCCGTQPAHCMSAFFRAMPPCTKRWFQLSIHAMARGASPEAADRLACERMIAVDGRPPFGDP